MPLKNKPYANKSISASSTNILLKHGYDPGVRMVSCELERLGPGVDRAHMIVKSTTHNEVRRLALSWISQLRNYGFSSSSEPVNGCSAMRQEHSTLIRITTWHPVSSISIFWTCYS
jgi:hypothetical protein